MDSNNPAGNIEWFDGTRKEGSSPAPVEPTLTIGRTGSVRLSSALTKLLGRPDHVRVGYIEECKTIVITPDISWRTARKLSYVRNGAACIVLTSFIAFWGITVRETRRYHADVRDGMAYIDLRQED